MNRGEPRGKLRKKDAGAEKGDCIDCGACVITCPTGIDIRDGLQMECIGCTQCIDACDTIMDKIDRPRGLIRYTSREILESGKRHILRPRVIAYPLLLIVVFSALGFALALGSIATVREILGTGKWFGLSVLPEAWPDWGIMVLPPGAFLTLGLLLALAEWVGQRRATRSAKQS